MRKHAATEAPERTASAAVEFFSRKLEFEIGPFTLKGILDAAPAKVLVIDVRNDAAYAEGHLPMSISIPLAELPGRIAKLPKDRTIVTYCGDITCQRSLKGALALAEKGFRVQHLIGGILEWIRKGYPVEISRSAEPDQPIVADRLEPEPTEAQDHEGGPIEQA